MKDERQYNNLVYLIRRGGGKVVSPDGLYPILFEATPSSSLPEALADRGSIANLGPQERLGLVAETITRDVVGGNPMKEPRTVHHAGINAVSLFALYPPKIPVPD